MPFDKDGTHRVVDIGTVESLLISGLFQEFSDDGKEADVLSTSTLRKLVEVALGLPLIDAFLDINTVLSQSFFESATGGNLDKLLDPFSVPRLEARAAEGVVTLNLDGVVSAPPAPGILFNIGDLVFIDSSGRRFENTQAIEPNDTDSVDVNVRATQQDPEYNLPAGAIIDVEPKSSASANFSTYVVNFTNEEPFTGGRFRETDSEYRARFQTTLGSIQGASVIGLTSSILSVDGVTGASVVENDTLAGGYENELFGGNESGESSDLIDTSTNLRIAQLVSIEEARFIQHLRTQFDVDNNAILNVRIEGHDETLGIPNNALFRDEYEKTGIFPNTTFNYDFSLANGQFCNGTEDEPNYVWVVFEPTSGSFQFGGGSGDVQSLNLASNPGFEAYESNGAPRDWTVAEGNTLVERESTLFNTGISSIKITSAGGTTEGIYQTAPLVPLVPHRFHVYARTNGVAGEQARLEIYNVTDDVVEASVTGTDAIVTWEKLSTTFTPAFDKEYQFRLLHEGGGDSGTSVYFDDIYAKYNGVKVFDGANWNLDSTLESLNMEVIGGIPPKSFRAYVSGGLPDNIADGIYGSRAAGIYSDGINSGDAISLAGLTVTERFERPQSIPVYISIEVKPTAQFTGDESSVRDAIIRYIGGVDSQGNLRTGLTVNEPVILNEVISRVLDDDEVFGLEDVLSLSIDTVDPPSATANLPGKFQGEYTIEALGDINVTLS